ncbi:MAG TPA: hypothetical protein VJ397_01485 [Thermoplasmata archaeon]|nr:hypothetical protein [Thermoplasmata archaeon]
MARRPQFVLDAAPLIALAAAGALDRILALDARFLVAEEVRDEVIGTAGQERRPESTAVEERIREGEIEVARVRDERLLRRVRENARLSSADCASLCLALERGALIADDRDLRAAARGLGADVGGSLFLLALGVDQGLSTGKEAVATVEKMVAAGWYCSPALLKGFTDAMVGK